MKYSIKDLERLTGIKAHSIRIWEKRYNLFEPQRSETNIRSYSDNDLKQLLNIAQLKEAGVKISKIAAMNQMAVRQEVLRLQENSSDIEVAIKRMIIAVVDINEAEFEKIFSDILMDFSFEELVTDYLFPFLERIGVLWQTGSITPAQEHFISNIIRTKLIVATDKLPVPVTYKPKRFILFLREGELHEIGLLFCNYLLRKMGYRTVYLGQSVPLPDLVSIQKHYEADYLLTSMINTNQDITADEFLEQAVGLLPNCRFIVLGGIVKDLDYDSPQISKYLSYKELKRHLLNI